MKAPVRQTPVRLALLAGLTLCAPAAFADVSYLFSGTGYSGIGQELVLGLSNGSSVTVSTGQNLFTAGSLNQGWWSADSANFDANDNIYVGALQPDPADPISLHRNFFTFSLAGITPGSIISAVLRINDVGYAAGSFPLTYSLYDVSTDAQTLNRNDDISQAIYDDLGSGRRYAAYSVAGAPAGSLAIGLNGDALADLNAAAGHFFSIGGTLDLPATPVSEPSMLALLGIGLAASRLGRGRAQKRVPRHSGSQLSLA